LPRTVTREAAGRYGAYKKWAGTADRTAATASARRNSPSNIDYWLARLDPERFAAATDAQKLAAAEAARSAHFALLAMRSAQARRRGGDAA